MPKIKHLEAKFTIASYGLITACEANELQLYLFLKLFAIQKSSAFPSFRTIEGQLGWDSHRIRRTLDAMEKADRLKIDKTDGRNNVYDIIWYDRLNQQGMHALEVVDKSEKTEGETPPDGQEDRRRNASTSEGETPAPGAGETPPELIGIKTNRNKTNNPPTPQRGDAAKPQGETALVKPIPQAVDMLGESRKDLQIIGLFAKAKKVTFENRDSVSSFVRRNLRGAKALVGYDPKRIANTMHWLIQNADFKWTLETVAKYIDEDLEKIRGQSAQCLNLDAL